MTSGVGISVFLVVVVLWAVVARMTQRRDHYDPNSYAALFARLPVEPFALYLRSFGSDDSAPRDDVQSRAALPGCEVKLAEALRILDIPLVLVGSHRGESLGKGLNSWSASPKHWRDEVSALRGLAGITFVVPGLSDGILWELKMLQDCPAMLRTTVFVRPPNCDPPHWHLIAVLLQIYIGVALIDEEGAVLANANTLEQSSAEIGFFRIDDEGDMRRPRAVVAATTAHPDNLNELVFAIRNVVGLGRGENLYEFAVRLGPDLARRASRQAEMMLQKEVARRSSTGEQVSFLVGRIEHAARRLRV